VPDTATIGDEAFNPETTVLRLSPASMRDLQRWYEAVDGALANKRCRPLLYDWLERAQDLPPLPFRPQGLRELPESGRCVRAGEPPVPLIVLPKSCSCRWGPPVLLQAPPDRRAGVGRVAPLALGRTS